MNTELSGETLLDVSNKIQYSGCLLREDGTLHVVKCVYPSRPLAKISEMEEEQEDPYLNDRCRGEPPGRLGVHEARGTVSAKLIGR